VLDAAKRGALTEALSTSTLLTGNGGVAVDESRGEPAFVFEVAGQTLAFVVEGLGTKSVIARQVEDDLGPSAVGDADDPGRSAFGNVAYDTVAAIVNDLCCVGALPLTVNAYFATGASEWYADQRRAGELFAGWREACADAGAAWGGGESPSLPGLVAGAEIELAGSAVGLIPRGRGPILGGELVAGDEIVLVASSGLHGNGSSLARKVAEQSPEGYRTPIGDGRPLGVALLDRTVIYTALVRAVLGREVPVHYLSHITGHGLLKLMRPRRELSYTIHRLPPVPPVLAHLVASAEMTTESAYSTFNMGAGFAVYCGRGCGEEVVRIASELSLSAHVAGVVGEGPRRVILEELGVVFGGEDLDLAPTHAS
jgi:phosphoribosylformylglycinamidine cyclo-ligase